MHGRYVMVTQWVVLYYLFVALGLIPFYIKKKAI